MQSVLTFLGIIAVFLIIAVWLGRINDRREKDRLRKQFRASFGAAPRKKLTPGRRESIPAYYRRHQNRRSLDNITWNDLDLDSVYSRLDSTRSAAGEEYLYYLLRTPAWENRERELPEDAVAWLGEKENEAARIQLEFALHTLGHTGRYSLLDYLDRLNELGERSSRRDYLCLLLILVCIGLMFLSVPLGVVLLIAALVWNMASYLSQKQEIEPYIVSFRYILRLLRTDERIVSVPCSGCSSLRQEQDLLQAELRNFDGFRRGSFMLMSGSGTGNPLDIVMDYIRMLLHLDLIKFNQMLGQVRTHRKELDTLVTLTGRIDAAIAVASYRKSLPCCCTMTEEKGDFHLKEVYHPLLPHPVPNSLDAGRPVLLTGSNASGKSTFLKAVALAALLGQSINTVCAREYRAGYFRLYTSMALRDNLQQGDSYFMVEIKSLKRIVDAAGEPVQQTVPVLCFIDEVLRGTNTIERIAASSEILEDFARSGVLCFAATHDIELSSLLEEYYDNYHFEETLRDNPATGRKDVVFSYLLHPGRAESRNAIRLLSAVGFDEGITGRAEARARHFEETGQWN